MWLRFARPLSERGKESRLRPVADDDDDTRPWPIDDDEETAIDMQAPSFFDRNTTITVRTTQPGVRSPELDVLECKGGSTREPLAWRGRCRAAPLRVTGAAITHPGLVREGNEDAFLVWPDSHLAVVADGMGGHQGGEVASAIAVESIRDALVHHGSASDVEHGSDMLCAAVATAHARINQLSDSQVELRGMGTTIVALWVLGEQALVVHVGDSRLYRLRDAKLEQITGDHSLAQELKNRGILDTQGMQSFPNKHILTQALGGKSAVRPEASVLDVRPGDRFILCSDGLSDFVDRKLMAAFIGTPSPPEVQARTLVEAALGNGGEDNVTVVVLHAEPL